MNGVKGLILKEFYLRRKTLLSGLTVFVLFFILAASFCLSFDYGNLRNNKNLSHDAAIILAYSIAGMGILLISQNGETIANDAKCKWDIFERTLPLSPQKLAAVKIGLLLGANLLGTAVSTALSAVIFTLAHRKFTLAVMANITAIALIVFVLMMIMDFLLLKFKSRQKAAMIFFVIIAAVYALFILWVRNRSAEISAAIDAAEAAADTDALKAIEALTIEEFTAPAAELRDRLFPFSVLIFAAVAVVGYFLFLSQIKRRDK